MSIHEKEEVLIGDWLPAFGLFLEFSRKENPKTAG